MPGVRYIDDAEFELLSVSAKGGHLRVASSEAVEEGSLASQRQFNYPKGAGLPDLVPGSSRFTERLRPQDDDHYEYAEGEQQRANGGG